MLVKQDAPRLFQQMRHRKRQRAAEAYPHQVGQLTYFLPARHRYRNQIDEHRRHARKRLHNQAPWNQQRGAQLQANKSFAKRAGIPEIDHKKQAAGQDPCHSDQPGDPQTIEILEPCDGE